MNFFLISSNRDKALKLKTRKNVVDSKVNFYRWILLSTILTKDEIETIFSFLFSFSVQLKNKYLLSIKSCDRSFPGTLYNDFLGQHYLPQETLLFIISFGRSPRFKCVYCGNYINCVKTDDDGDEFYVYYLLSSKRHSIYFENDKEFYASRLLGMCNRKNVKGIL